MSSLRRSTSYFCRAMLCKSASMPSCGVCPSLRPSRSCILSKRINIFSNFFSPPDRPTILVFPCQTLWQYTDGNPLTKVSNAVSGGKNRDFDQYLASSRAVNAATAMCYQHLATAPWQVGDTRRGLLMAGDDDEVFMIRSLNVTPKTTEQHLIRSGKSEAEVTDNRRVCSRYCTTEANYWQTRSIARQQIATCYIYIHHWKRITPVNQEEKNIYQNERTQSIKLEHNIVLINACLSKAV